MVRPDVDTYTVDTSFIFTKKSNVAKCFFDIFNAEIAQCRQQLDVILGTKVVEFRRYQKIIFDATGIKKHIETFDFFFVKMRLVSTVRVSTSLSKSDYM